MPNLLEQCPLLQGTCPARCASQGPSWWWSPCPQCPTGSRSSASGSLRCGIQQDCLAVPVSGLQATPDPACSSAVLLPLSLLCIVQSQQQTCPLSKGHSCHMAGRRLMFCTKACADLCLQQPPILCRSTPSSMLVTPSHGRSSGLTSSMPPGARAPCGSTNLR